MIVIMMHKLRGLRTFLLCSANLNRTELTRSKILMRKLTDLRRHPPCLSDYTDTTLASLLVRIEGVVSRFSGTRGIFRDELPRYLVDIESFEEEMDEWYTSLSLFLQQSSYPAAPDQVRDIFSSVVENLEDFLTLQGAYVGVLVEPVTALKENIAFLRNFICFATLLGADRFQEFHDLLTLILPLAVSSAHLTAHLFSSTHYDEETLFKNVTDFKREFSYEGMKSTLSTLLVSIIIPLENPRLYETYIQALKSIKNAKELYVPTLDLENFITFLLSALWEMLQFDTDPVVSLKDKLQALYEGLRFLTATLEKKPNEFVDRVGDIAAAAAFDAGAIIFSLHHKDLTITIDHVLLEFLENIQVIRTKVLEVQVVKTSESNFPNTTVLAFLDFLFDYLTQVTHSDTMSYVSKIRTDVIFLKSFMGKLVELRNQQQDLHQAVWNFAVEVAHKIEFLIDQLVLGNILDSFIISFQSITEDMMIIEMDSTNIFNKMIPEIGVQKVTCTSTDQVPSQSSTLAADEVVGFETERSSIVDRLERGSKTLQVVAVVGMPGLGKTTLATKVYNDPSVGYHFHVRARCTISQVFDRRKVLLELLNHIRLGENSTENDDDLAQELRRSLLGRRYLIFIDDVWDMQTFDCLKESFPDNSSGSRILLTSRQGDLVPEAIFLLQLTVDESLELLQRKLFPARKDWPPALQMFGMEVAEYCKGLPLTIIIVAGILTATREDVWKEVLESLRSGIISTLTDNCVNSIELSYKHLPHYLKPCFLSFGAFPEDHVVSVNKLIWQWIAEGFVRTSDSKRLKDVAMDYLNMLIDRSLVMKSGEKSRGAVKALRIHDLLHDFCLRKSIEELSSQVLKREPLPFDEVGNLRRLSIHSSARQFKESNLFCPHLRSLLFFHQRVWNEMLNMSFICRIYKLLRVLAMDKVGLAHFPSEIGFLVQLRYLEIQVDRVVSSSIGNLTNLETLILHPNTEGPIELSDTFWNLQKLRHLYLSSKFECIELPENNPDSSRSLVELESLGTLHCYEAEIMEKQLRKLPNIRRLKCRVIYDLKQVLSFSFLSQLESLLLSSSHVYSTKYIFPENIRELNLDLRGSPWDMISTSAQLPNLEVLKLICCKFTTNTWHVNEGEFPKLKFLKLKYLDMVKWTAASDDQFSNLEKLVLEGCHWLEEIPECLENVATLKLIEVSDCLDCVGDLVKRVEQCQSDMGNSELQVHVRYVFHGYSADWYYAQEQAIGS